MGISCNSQRSYVTSNAPRSFQSHVLRTSNLVPSSVINASTLSSFELPLIWLDFQALVALTPEVFAICSLGCFTDIFVLFHFLLTSVASAILLLMHVQLNSVYFPLGSVKIAPVYLITLLLDRFLDEYSGWIIQQCTELIGGNGIKVLH